MDASLAHFALTAFVTLLVVVDPVGVAPIFVAVTRQLDAQARRRTLARAVMIAFAVTLFFLFAGRWLLSYLGVTVHAFTISGGILLFATALPMLFGQRPALQGPQRGDYRGGSQRAGEDVAVFPLAIPLLSGPGTITTILLLTNQPGPAPLQSAAVLAAAALVFLATWLILRTADVLMLRLGESRIHILTRVLGIVLAALAVQFVLEGITGYYESLLRR
jgi:multiple antibiotic resistance protein